MGTPITFLHFFWILFVCILGDLVFSFVIFYFYKAFCHFASVDDPFNDRNSSRLPFWISGYATGFIERLFFAIGVALNLSGVGVAMIAWTALKAQSHWQIFTPREGEERFENIKIVYVSVLTSLVSMLFAVFIGTLCSIQSWR